MVYEKGHYTKDLTYLNRELSRIVVIEKDPLTLERQSANGIFINPFSGDSNDKTLFELIPLLERTFASP